MAATLHTPRNDPGANVHVNLYPRALMTELDYKDNRYPALQQQQPRSPQRQSARYMDPSDRYPWDISPSSNDILSPSSNTRAGEPLPQGALNPMRLNDARSQPDHQLYQPAQYRNPPTPDPQSFQSQSSPSQPPQSSPQQQQQQYQYVQPQQHLPETQRTGLSYALPPGARRVVERYSLDENNPQRAPSRASGETRPTGFDTNGQDTSRSRSGTPLGASRPLTPQERPTSILPTGTTPRQSSLPITGINPGSPSLTGVGLPSPTMPLAASPGYVPPIATKQKAYPQQPTYVTPPVPPNPVNPVYTPVVPQPAEEVCVECAMRDQDMADVDVTSPGVWDRESDVLYEELLRREQEDDANGTAYSEDTGRPRAKGGRLTEQNLRIWLTLNPKEPASRQQTLDKYIKDQRKLLEAEALAHARAMQEARQLDNRMRDAYSQLRRSAYDTGNTAAPIDDTGGVRIRPPKSPILPMHARSQSREVTLLENGMIVEHVDVRREEREARERRRREEKRARKSSRSSGIDVTSIMSGQTGQSLALQTDNGLGLRPQSRYSQASAGRPASAFTAPPEGDIPPLSSGASFTSLASASPRRSRFFGGFRSMSSGWRSQDSFAPSGISGSMVNMHLEPNRDSVALQHIQVAGDLHPLRNSQAWSSSNGGPEGRDSPGEEKAKKKKTGLAKIWQIVTGSHKADTSSNRPPTTASYDRTDDDAPLAPPPPLSLLVDRGGPGDLISKGRAGHASTPSLPTTASPKPMISQSGMSPSTAPSSLLPSPASSRPMGPDADTIEIKYHDEQDQFQSYRPDSDNHGKNLSPGSRNMHSMTSEPDMRQRISHQDPIPPVPPLPLSMQISSSQSAALAAISSASRDKSLPPLPGEPRARTITAIGDLRPRTVYTYDRQPVANGPLSPHEMLPPGAAYARRQSFSGIPSRPLNSGTLPMSTRAPEMDGMGAQYDEFGASRRSLVDPSRNSAIPSTKRKSRFTLSSLLGKKNVAPEPEYINENLVAHAHVFPSSGRSGSDGQDEHVTNGYATSTSRHSTPSQAPRNSILHRKPLDELVSQDAEFVAYRYPSNDQRLDLLR
ncbi:hypothetical protein AX16_002023 [Volvariella volvacea WC 439]|nr:hypothetical protein AX16_002023 [Volvariella volvacea WC 439]